MRMRTIDISNHRGRIVLTENEHDDTTVIDIDSGDSIELTSEQLWQLGAQIMSWFDAKVVRHDDQQKAAAELRERIERVLSENESRCMDDDVDRGVVVRELVKALS